MAQRTIITLVSDLSGTEEDAENGIAITTLPFAVDGIAWEVDVTDEEAAAFRNFVADYRANARQLGKATVGGTARKQSATTPTPAPARTASAPSAAPNAAPNRYDRATNQAIREWAKGQGMTVSERGRIPAEVTEAWEKAHPAGAKGANVGPRAARKPSPADAPDADTAPAELAGDDPADDATEGVMLPPTGPLGGGLSVVPDAPAGEPVEEKVGPDGLTGTEREEIRAWALAQGMEVRAKGILKKDLITSARQWKEQTGKDYSEVQAS